MRATNNPKEISEGEYHFFWSLFFFLIRQPFRTCPSERSKTRDWPWYFRLRRGSTSTAIAWIPWRSRSFRLDEDQGRSSDLEQVKWLYRKTQTKIKAEAISLFRIIVLCGPYDFHSCPRIVRVWPFEVTRLVETDFEETLKIFEIFRRRMNHFASNSVINFVPNQTCECVQLQWRCCMTMQDFFHMEMPFTRHCGTRIFPMSWGGSHWHHDFNDDEAWKVWKSMESCGAAWVGSSDWANHLQSQVKKTMERRKERFLSAAEAAWQETNTCKYSRFESIESQFSSCFEYSGPTHCIASTSPMTKKRQRENLRLTQNRWEQILASHLPAMPRKTSFSFAQLLGFVRFQGLRSCNAYNLWFRMLATKSNPPTCLRWIPQRNCWRFLTCSKRWNDALVAPMCDFWCW